MLLCAVCNVTHGALTAVRACVSDSEVGRRPEAGASLLTAAGAVQSKETQCGY